MQSASELVYVVDDDRRVREALSALLRANGRDVRAFNSGSEFLETPRQKVAACLILDLRMPGIKKSQPSPVDSFELFEECGLVRRRGLEPLCLAALAPQASASANFATSAGSLTNAYAWQQ